MANNIPGQPNKDHLTKNAMHVGLWQQAAMKKKLGNATHEDSQAQETSAKFLVSPKKQGGKEAPLVAGDSVVLHDTAGRKTIPLLDNINVLSSKLRGVRLGQVADPDWLSRHKKEIVLAAVFAGVIGIIGYALLGSPSVVQTVAFEGGHSGGAGFGGIF